MMRFIKKIFVKLMPKSVEELYGDLIREMFQFIDLIGLNAILLRKLRLEELFVELKAKVSLQFDDLLSIKEFESLKRDDSDDNKESVNEFVTLFRQFLEERQNEFQPLRMVILGQPGCGKTTLMKWIALNAVKPESNHFSDFMPLFFSLKDFGADPDSTCRSLSLVDMSRQFFQKIGIDHALFESSFEGNRVIFLLDGLDEVADEGIRREVIAWIEEQQIRRNCLLVTSRFSGVRHSDGLTFSSAFPVIALQGFGMDDIELFLKKWYGAIEMAVAEKPDEKRIAKEAGEKGDELFKIISSHSYESLKELASNPLLLTIIAIVHRTRAVLPRERFKLYDEILKVMIELWNIANRKVHVSFSVDNSIANLSKIALFLMENNRRELTHEEMTPLLDEEIEGRTRDLFIREMVLKAGILYESEGKYGFLHLTLQEYLTALCFAKSSSQNSILEYRERDYWKETLKLFVNMGNAELLFNEVINNLMEKGYWKYMSLWEECMEEIIVESVKKKVEKAFAVKVLHILGEMKYEEEDEAVIEALYLHYPLYLYSADFEERAWKLFHYTGHPFVQSLGASLLNRCGSKTKEQLMDTLKQQIIEFASRESVSESEMTDFMLRHNNTFFLLIGSGRSVVNFTLILKLLKGKSDFITFKMLKDLQSLRDLRDLIDLRYLRYLRYLRDLRDLISSFNEKWSSVINSKRDEISVWADKELDKITALPDEKIMELFPGTSEQDLNTFRLQISDRLQISESIVEAQKPPIGRSDFLSVIRDNYYYIDKSLFIQEVIADSSQVILIPRPRRFGKTLNLSMLRYFYEKSESETASLFKNLAIYDTPQFQMHQGKYAVIFLTFKDVKAFTFQACFKKLTHVIGDEWKRHEYLLSGDLLSESEKEEFSLIRDRKVTFDTENSLLERSLFKLSEYLYRYYGRKTVVLIDEYDTPVHSGYFEGYYKEIIAFFRDLLSSALKDNDKYLEKAVLTGILRVAKESVFTGLNNLGVYTVLDESFADKFGITEDETKQLLTDFSAIDHFDEVSRWYNGYRFGRVESIYNPWSLLNFVNRKEKEFQTWWLNTSENSLVRQLLIDTFFALEADLAELLEGRAVSCRIVEHTALSDLQAGREAVWSFFVFSGYLKVAGKQMVNDVWIYDIMIPNRELRIFFRDTVKEWLRLNSGSKGSHGLDSMLIALSAGEIILFEEYLQALVKSVFSHHDFGSEQERVYHSFVLGLLVHLGDSYTVRSNRESGFGRYDIMLIPMDKEKAGIILELKRIKEGDSSEKAIDDALDQVKEKEYGSDFETHHIKRYFAVAVVFEVKKVYCRKLVLKE